MATLTRSRPERRDSVTEDIIKEREEHLQRLEFTASEAGEKEIILAAQLQKMGLGRRKAGGDARKHKSGEVGAGGRAKYLTSCARAPWPRLKHRLPEVALAGHSNCGKSTLLNALAGLGASNGPARVSDRAGWTDALFWYQMGKRPPVLTLVDLPGYGHAVADHRTVAAWGSACDDFLTRRVELARTCVLVDATRG